MAIENLAEAFEKHDDEYVEFENVPPERKLSNRPDLCAFLLLEKLVPGTSDIVSAAEHDMIWLDVDVEALAKVATDDDILTLVRCGVRYDDEHDMLSLYT